MSARMNESAIPDACRRAQELLLEHRPAAEGEPHPDREVCEHLATCPECAEIKRLWFEMGELPWAQPEASQRRRFEQMLAEFEAAEREAPRRRRMRFGAWLTPPAWAAAALCLGLGLGAGWLLRGTRAPAPAPASDQSQQIAALREEVHTTGQLVVLSLLQQESASDRLRGVNWSYRLPDPDPQVTDALIRSLNTDSSPDVRLAALEALERQAGHSEASALDPDLRQELVESFQHQKSPLLQVALVDSFVATHDTRARALLRQISNGTQYDPEVRQRAQWGLTQWN